MIAIPNEPLKLHQPSQSMEELPEKYELMPDDIATAACQAEERKHGG